MNFKDYIHQETQIDNETLTLLDNLFLPKLRIKCKTTKNNVISSYKED